MKTSDNEGCNMHAHSFREITEYLVEANVGLGYPEDEILHVFECSCGLTLIEKRRPLQSSSGQKKTTIYTVLRKPVLEFPLMGQTAT